jgi:hypothetical protein
MLSVGCVLRTLSPRTIDLYQQKVRGTHPTLALLRKGTRINRIRMALVAPLEQRVHCRSPKFILDEAPLKITRHLCFYFKYLNTYV